MRPRRLKNEINVVPYIDVMLVLLVIFMVTAPMMTTASIDVPSISKAPQAKNALNVNVRADRTLTLQYRDEKEQSVTLGELVQKIAAEQKQNPETRVAIAADRNIRYQAVVDVVDELQKRDVRHIALIVQATGK